MKVICLTIVVVAGIFVFSIVSIVMIGRADRHAEESVSQAVAKTRSELPNAKEQLAIWDAERRRMFSGQTKYIIKGARETYPNSYTTRSTRQLPSRARKAVVKQGAVSANPFAE